MRQLLLPLLLCFMASGCIAQKQCKYPSLNEIPENEQPLYQVTLLYQQCALINFAQAIGETKEELTEELFEELAVKATDSCTSEFENYVNFVRERTEDEKFTDRETKRFASATQKHMVNHVISLKEKILALPD